MVERDNSLADIDIDGYRIADNYISGIELQAAIMGAEKDARLSKRYWIGIKTSTSFDRMVVWGWM